MKWFHVIGQGRDLHTGFNFYPWYERNSSIGIRFLWQNGTTRTFWGLRYNPSLNTLFRKTYTITKKQYERQRKNWPDMKEWNECGKK